MFSNLKLFFIVSLIFCLFFYNYSRLRNDNVRLQNTIYQQYDLISDINANIEYLRESDSHSREALRMLQKESQERKDSLVSAMDALDVKVAEIKKNNKHLSNTQINTLVSEERLKLVWNAYCADAVDAKECKKG